MAHTAHPETPAAPTVNVKLTHQLLILWVIVTSRPSFLNAGGLSPADLKSISKTLGLPLATVEKFVTHATQNQAKFVAVANDFHSLAVDGGYDGPICPTDLGIILSLAKGI